MQFSLLVCIARTTLYLYQQSVLQNSLPSPLSPLETVRVLKKRVHRVMCGGCGMQACSNYYNTLLLFPQRCCWWRRGGGSASQQPLLCRIHAVKLWLFKREKQKATAPLLNIVSFPSVSVFLSPSPPLPHRPPPPLPLLHTHTLSICLLIRDWQREVREESTQYAAHSTGGGSPKCPGFPWGGQMNVYGRSGWTSEGSERFCTPAQLTCNKCSAKLDFGLERK